MSQRACFFQLGYMLKEDTHDQLLKLIASPGSGGVEVSAAVAALLSLKRGLWMAASPSAAANLTEVTDEESLLLARFRNMPPHDKFCMMRLSEAFDFVASGEEKA
jgi:hypothetical protein